MRKWNLEYDVPENKQVRVLIYSDAKNEADDQFAIAHFLMTPKCIVEGFVAGHFNGNPQEYGVGNTAKASYAEIEKVLGLMDLADDYKIAMGSEYPLENETTPIESDGAKFIVETAMKDDPRPLYIACLGGITDLASAILMEPKICDKMTAIWIGGGNYPEGCSEFNMKQDVNAVNILFSSTMPVWQVPKNVYKQVSVSLAQLQLYVKPCGELGKYLFEQMVAYNRKMAAKQHWPHGEVWGLGDSPTIGLLLFENELYDVYDEVPAPRVEPGTWRYIHDQDNRKIRVYKDANARLLLEDFFAKMQINFK